MDFYESPNLYQSVNYSEAVCEDYHDLNSTELCDFALNVSSCEMEGFIPYIEVLLCSENMVKNTNTWTIGMNVLYTLWCLWLFIILGVTTDSFFVPTLTKISKQLGLSDTVAGVTLVAFGNGAPDIFSAIASFTATDPKVARLAVGAVLGAGMFVIMAVGGATMIVAPFRPAARPLIRDMVLYIWAVYWLLQCLYKEKIELSDSVGFLGLYVVFVIGVVLGNKFLPKKPDELYPAVEHNEVPISAGTIPASPMVKNRIRALSNLSNLSANRPASPRVTRTTGTDNGAYLDPAQQTRSRAGTNVSIASNLSTKSTTLKPFAKNCARALSNISAVDQSNKAELVEEAAQERHLWREIFIPWDEEEFSEGNAFDKAISIIASPVYLLCKVTIPVVGDAEADTWNRPLAVINGLCMPWAFYLLLAQVGEEPFGSFPRYGIPLILSVSLAVLIFLATMKTKNEPPAFYKFFTIVSFLTSVLWIFAEANEIVSILTALGLMWKIDNVVMGLTFLAWANSIGDFVADISLARIGKARTALAACFGAPLLNLLFGTGLGCSIGIATQEREFVAMGLYELELSLCGSVLFAVTTLCFIFPLIKFQAGRPLGIYLFCLYIVGLTLCILFGTGTL